MVAPAPAQRVREVVGPAVLGTGLVLEDVEVSRAGARSVVRVTVDLPEDAEGPLDLDHVADVSRAVSDALDVTDAVHGEYTLEVSSPGVSRPLTERRHFVRAVGRLVRLDLRDGGTVAGRLQEVDRSCDPAVLVTVPLTVPGKGRRPVLGAPVRTSLDEVRAGHVEVELTGLGAHDDDLTNGLEG